MTKLTGLQLAVSMMAAVVVAFLSSTESQAQHEPWGNPYDALLERPGVEIENGTIEDLETSIQRRRESEQKELTAIEDKAAACRKSDFADLVTAFATAPDEQLEKNLEEDLSLPRIPVKNPCL